MKSCKLKRRSRFAISSSGLDAFFGSYFICRPFQPADLPYPLISFVMSCVLGRHGRHLVAETEGSQCPVVQAPWVTGVARSARGGDCPVFGTLDCDVAEHEQRGAGVFPGVSHLVRGEDDFRARPRSSTKCTTHTLPHVVCHQPHNARSCPCQAGLGVGRSRARTFDAGRVTCDHAAELGFHCALVRVV